MLKIPLLVSLGHHGGRRKVASSRPPFSTPLRSLGEPDPETPFPVPIEHAPPLFVRIREDKISLKISPAPLTGGLESCLATQVGSKAAPRPLRFCSNRAFRLVISCCTLLMRCHCLRPSFRLRRALLLLRRLLRGLLLLLRRLCCCGNWEGGLQRLFLGPL